MSNDPQPLRPYNKNEPYELTKKNILNPHKLNRVTTNEPKNVSSNVLPSTTTPSNPITVPLGRRRKPRIAPPPTTYLQELNNGTVVEISESVYGGKKRHTKKHHKKSRRTKKHHKKSSR